MSAPEIPGNLITCRDTFTAESKPGGLFRAFSIPPRVFYPRFADAVMRKHIEKSEEIQGRAENISVLAGALGNLVSVPVARFDEDGNYHEITISPQQGYMYASFAIELEKYGNRIALYNGRVPDNLSRSGVLPTAAALCKIAAANLWAVEDDALAGMPQQRLYDPQVGMFLNAALEGNFLPT